MKTLPGKFRRFLSLALLGLAGLGGVRAVGAEEATISKEYQLKAAFLYNFTKFVEWPAARFADETSPIVIGVVGRNPFGDELEKSVRGRPVNGRAILVKAVATAEDVTAVHLLFVPAAEEARLPAGVWKNFAVVAVGESPAFAALGGTITFVQAGDKVRFEINLAAAERSRVKISTPLLKLATVVHRQPEGKR